MGATMSSPTMAGRLLPAAGHHTPARDRLAAALREAVAYSRSPSKELARRIGLTPKGAELLLRGDSSPRAETLLAACREFDVVWAELQALCGREPTDAERVLDELAARLRDRKR
jgi:transcriptional regulator with XRE-family HTH domain